MFRRLMSILLAVLLLPAAAAYAEEASEDVLAQEIRRLVDNEDYVSMFSMMSASDAVLELFAGCSWTQPAAQVYLSGDAEVYAAQSMVALGEESPENAVELIQAALPTLITRQVIQPEDYAESIAINVAQSAAFRIDPDQADGSMLYLRFYEDGMPILYCLRASEGAVMITATACVGAEGLGECRSALDVQAWLDANEVIGVTAYDEPVLMANVDHDLEGGTRARSALSLVQTMAIEAADPQYIGLTGVQAEEAVALLADWTSGDFTSPRLMAETPLTMAWQGTALFAPGVLKIMYAEDDTALRCLTRSIGTTAAMHTMLMSLARSGRMNAFNIVSVATMYADPAQEDGAGLIVLLFTEGRHAMVSWYAENGVVMLNAFYLPLPELDGVTTAAEVSLWLIGNGLPAQCVETGLE